MNVKYVFQLDFCARQFGESFQKFLKMGINQFKALLLYLVVVFKLFVLRCVFEKFLNRFHA